MKSLTKMVMVLVVCLSVQCLFAQESAAPENQKKPENAKKAGNKKKAAVENKPAAPEKAEAKSQVWDFEDIQAGKIPDGWKTMSALSTAGKNPGDTCTPHAIFEVVKVDGGQAIKLVRHEQAVYDDGHHCWTDKIAFTDGTLSARVMAEDTVKGHCGLAFRIKDHKNYYAVRYSVVEGNIALVRVKDGVPVWDKNAKVSTGDAKGTNQWFDLKVEVAGSTITAFVNGKQMFQYTDAEPLAGPGGVGLFSRGEQAVVLWDDFKVVTK
jgi:hypothetical protein